MTTVLLVDDSAHACELFADTIRQRLDFDVVTLRSPGEVTADLVHDKQIDVAVVDLSFPGDALTGADVLLQLHLDTPSTRLIILTDGDAWAADLLRDSWEVLPIACALSKSSPVSVQLDATKMLDRVDHRKLAVAHRRLCTLVLPEGVAGDATKPTRGAGLGICLRSCGSRRVYAYGTVGFLAQFGGGAEAAAYLLMLSMGG